VKNGREAHLQEHVPKTLLGQIERVFLASNTRS
jgi:hypothetical protein